MRLSLLLVLAVVLFLSIVYTSGNNGMKLRSGSIGKGTSKTSGQKGAVGKASKTGSSAKGGSSKPKSDGKTGGKSNSVSKKSGGKSQSSSKTKGANSKGNSKKSPHFLRSKPGAKKNTGKVKNQSNKLAKKPVSKVSKGITGTKGSNKAASKPGGSTSIRSLPSLKKGGSAANMKSSNRNPGKRTTLKVFSSVSKGAKPPKSRKESKFSPRGKGSGTSNRMVLRSQSQKNKVTTKNIKNGSVYRRHSAI
jgi:hypothetical protein